MLNDYRSIAILSCGTCANLSFTGGKTGIEILKELLQKKGKDIKLARVVLACCPEEIMRQALKMNRRKIKKCDALVVLSCAAGIKSANSCSPGPQIINVLDSVGSSAVSCSDPLLSQSLCTGCGQCVLTYTAGICPISECPAKSKYGPCKAASRNSPVCTIDPDRDCVWHIIEERSDITKSMNELIQLHRNDEERIHYVVPEKGKSNVMEKFFAWHAARFQSLERVIRFFR